MKKMKMKKTAATVLAALSLVLFLTGCGSKADPKSDSGATAPSADPAQSQTAAAQTDKVEVNDSGSDMPTVLNTMEYSLYQNIFFNGQMDDFDGKQTEKEGVFTILTDAYNKVTRYYVWGYNDETKCCDWQWELKLSDTKDLPTNGSLVTVTGKYAKNEDALDKFWIIDPVITVNKAYQGKACDVDMLAMSDTLERVQTFSVVNYPDVFEGQLVRCYGRMKNDGMIEDPYYDESWGIAISGDYKVPAFGTMVEVSGTVSGGELIDCTVTPTTRY